jgi:DNA-binding transcriptional LysR family regulator
MRFKGLDLNLLVAFDALVELRSVSRTGERLGLSQPAVSAALARLREYFDDELMVVDGKRMHLTPFAQTLIPRVRACLNAADTVVATSATFDPSTAIRTFRIISSDYVLAAVLARVARQFASIAPRVRLEFVLPDEPATERFVRGEMDMIIAPSEFLVEAIQRASLRGISRQSLAPARILFSPPASPRRPCSPRATSPYQWGAVARPRSAIDISSRYCRTGASKP